MPPRLPSLPPGLCICRDPECKIPYGECHCRCGKKTMVPDYSDMASGRLMGVPVKYIKGHNHKIFPEVENASPFKIDGVYCRLIPLTQGFHATVDASDYEWLMQCKWCVVGLEGSIYARRHERDAQGNRVSISMHRQIMGEAAIGSVGDHQNGNSIDNRRANLRPSSKSNNNRNRKRHKNNTSGFIGVSTTKGKRKTRYKSSIRFEGNFICLGTYDTAQEASSVRHEAAKKYFGEFARFE